MNFMKMTFQSAYFKKGQFKQRRERLLEAMYLVTEDIHLIHLYFYMAFYFKDKNVLYTVSVNVLSSGLRIKDFLWLNMHLLADRSKNILFKNNKISIPQEMSEGQDQRGILIFC